VRVFKKEGKNMRRYGFILLAIWLILTGLITLFNFHFSGEAVILGLLALAGGVLLLLEDTGIGRARGRGERGRGRFNIAPGILLLAIWLILTGLFSLFSFSFTYENILLGLLALAAGVLLVIGR
jgi:hypothetical protein